MKPKSSLPKPLEMKVVRVARRLRKPARRVLTEAMNRVADEIDTRPDPALAFAARSILEHTEW